MLSLGIGQGCYGMNLYGRGHSPGKDNAPYSSLAESFISRTRIY